LGCKFFDKLSLTDRMSIPLWEFSDGVMRERGGRRLDREGVGR
jgi:hypothetical protein